MKRFGVVVLLVLLALTGGCKPPKTDKDLRSKLGLPDLPGMEVVSRFDVYNIPDGFVSDTFRKIKTSDLELDVAPALKHVRDVYTIQYRLSGEHHEDIVEAYKTSLLERGWKTVITQNGDTKQVGVFNHDRLGVFILDINTDKMGLYYIRGKIDIGKVVDMFSPTDLR